MQQPTDFSEQMRRKLHQECHDELGYFTARKSKAIKPDEAMLKTLEAEATSKASSVGQAYSERMQQILLQKRKDAETDLPQRKLDRDRAGNKLDAALQHLASCEEPGAYPKASATLQWTTTMWLAASLAPSCRDLLLGLDDFMRWFVGAAAATGISLAVVQGILPGSEPHTDTGMSNKTLHNGAFIAGLMLGAGFLCLRLANTRTAPDLFVAAGLALAEMGAVVLLERRAKALYATIAVWLERTRIYRLAQANVRAEEDASKRRQGLMDDATKTIDGVDEAFEYVHAFIDQKPLQNIAVSAVRAGYLKGIAENAADLGVS